MEKKDRQEQNIFKNKRVVWDCESSLYDSFELRSIKRQLDSAIAARCYSMPHLSDPPPAPRKPSSSSKISRWSIHRLLRSLFRPAKSAASDGGQIDHDDYYFGGHPGWCGGVLAAIPEVAIPEKNLESPFDSALRRTASERFTGTAAAAGILPCSTRRGMFC